MVFGLGHPCCGACIESGRASGWPLVGLHVGVANLIEGCSLFVQECPYAVDMG